MFVSPLEYCCCGDTNSCSSCKKRSRMIFRVTISVEESDLTCLVVSHIHTSIYGVWCCLVLKYTYCNLSITQSLIL